MRKEHQGNHLQLFSTVLMGSTLFLIGIMGGPVSAQMKIEWGSEYAGPGNGEDYATDVAVDGAGNVYVTGNSVEGRNVFATIKYDGHGNEVWVAHYAEPAGFENYAKALAVDSSGNVYVTGTSGNSTLAMDFATIKYNPNGTELWVARYRPSGSTGWYPGSTLIAVDASGNVYVTGGCYKEAYHSNYTTIKYDTNGNLLWVATYNSPDNMSGSPKAFAVDSSGSVYVTGESEGFCDTVKYDSNGNRLWVARYSTPESTYFQSAALAVDAFGDVYIAGTVGFDSSADFLTVKYDANGNQLWAARYNGPRNSTDRAGAIALDAAGNVYVSGDSTGIGTANDYATVKYDTNGNQLWVARYEGIDFDYFCDLAVDSAGNVYVTGNSRGTREPNHFTAQSCLTIKYDTDGSELWVVRSNNPTPAWPASLAVDASGNVYVTGYTWRDHETADYFTMKLAPTDGIGDTGDKSGGPLYRIPKYHANAFGMDSEGNLFITGSIDPDDSLFSDWVTIKYDQNIRQLWEVRHDGPIHEGDSAKLIAFDGTDVYVAGVVTILQGAAYEIVKYDRNGNEIWKNSYDGTSGDPCGLSVDREGNVYLVGYSGMIKYDKNGNQIWSRGDVIAWHSAVDSSANIYVTENFTTTKYGGDGTLKWQVSSEQPSGAGITAIALDREQNIYVTGYSGVDRFWLNSVVKTIKYDPEGNIVWMASLIGGSQSPTALAIDSDGNVIVGAVNMRSAAPNLILKYDSSGKQLWEAQFNGRPVALEVDQSANIYVTGVIYGSEPNDDYATAKYDSNGSQVWFIRWNGTSNLYDIPIGLLLDSSEESLFVAGLAEAAWKEYGGSFELIKYSADTGNEQSILEVTSNGGGGGGGCFITSSSR
jgi:hypothetical protein